MKNEIIEVGGRNWLVREAKTLEHALSAVAMARVTGSVGSKHNTIDASGTETVDADVVRLNEDGSECKPS